MKNVALSAYTSSEICRLLTDRSLSVTGRLQIQRLIHAIDSGESFTVNSNQMNKGQRDMVHGIIRDVAKHTGATFEDLKQQVKEHFGIKGSFSDLSQKESIELCDKIRAWVNG